MSKYHSFIGLDIVIEGRSKFYAQALCNDINELLDRIITVEQKKNFRLDIDKIYEYPQVMSKEEDDA